ncbi:MAG: hypothetical protein Q8K36_07065, partial [Alphaproteobacteria bacterium]|nr:hypothetical protein [Alphaproteobacteria bacterium]
MNVSFKSILRHVIYIIALVTAPLLAVDRYVGFEMHNYPAFNPNIAYLNRGVIQTMRINGLFGTQDMCPDRKWRHSTFEHHADRAMELENKLSYPCDAIAALLHWCYPSPARIVLEKNVGKSDILGVIANLPDPDAQAQAFAVILRITADLMQLPVSPETPDPKILDIKSKWDMHFYQEIFPHSETFFNILLQAVRLSSTPDCPSYYKSKNDKNIVAAILMTYVTDVLTEREHVIAALTRAGLLEDKEIKTVAVCNETYYETLKKREYFSLSLDEKVYKRH